MANEQVELDDELSNL